MRTLSKSDYKLARSCEAKLYFRENGYPDNSASNQYLQLLAFGGFMVEALARAKYPEGILLTSSRDVDADVARTRELLEREHVTLFQATLLWKRRLVRADIIEKRGNVIKLIEVKAKSFDSAEHAEKLRDGGLGAFRNVRKPWDIKADWVEKFEDVAFQAVVLERVMPGATVKPCLLLMDKCKRSLVDDLPTLFDIATTTAADGLERAHSAQYIGSPEALALIDLMTEVDASAEVEFVRARLDALATRYEEMLDAAFDQAWMHRGANCIDCQFKVGPGVERNGFSHCWGEMASVSPHALDLMSIGAVKDSNGGSLIEALAAAGTVSLFDVPQDRLVKKDGTVGPQAVRQIRQLAHTHSGECWVGPELAGKVHALRFPVHFIDFEATRLALPYHAKMRPYGQVAFQWSCHTVDAPGAAPRHTEWLNDTAEWPNLKFATSLRAVIGDSDTVLTWSGFEGSQLREIAHEHERFAAHDESLVAWVQGLTTTRIVDLHDWAKYDFYHPGMRGRTSIKVVLDALWQSEPAMRAQFVEWTALPADQWTDPYHALPAVVIAGIPQDVREGTGAMRAYEAMMYGVEKGDARAKTQWRQLLLQYCKLDTMSMVLIFEHWRRATSVGSLA